MQRAKMTILMLLSLLTLSSYAAVPAFALSVGGTTIALDTTDACAGLTQIDSSQDCSSDGSSVSNVIHDAINILSIIAGTVAVVMIIVSGFKYMTSGGDSAKVGSAKNTLIYALIGIAIAFLAQVLVHYVINTATNTVH